MLINKYVSIVLLQYSSNEKDLNWTWTLAMAEYLYARPLYRETSIELVLPNAVPSFTDIYARMSDGDICECNVCCLYNVAYRNSMCPCPVLNRFFHFHGIMFEPILHCVRFMCGPWLQNGLYGCTWMINHIPQNPVVMLWWCGHFNFRMNISVFNCSTFK